MRRIVLICFLSLASAPTFAMEQEAFSHAGHPSLPDAFYEEKYAKVLEDQEVREVLKTFAQSRLKALVSFYKTGMPLYDRGELSATSFALYHTSKESAKELMAVQIYGKLVAEMSMHAFRKALGVTMGMGTMSNEEKQTLRQISPEEFRKLMLEKYTEADFMRVEHVEQIHAHRKLLDLLEKKK
jgi:hypothetical protein